MMPELDVQFDRLNADVLPLHLFLADIQPDQDTCSLREGAFSTADAADEWLHRRSGPPPIAPQELVPGTTHTCAVVALITIRVAPDASTVLAAAPTVALSAQSDRGQTR
ncbi:hypothetical protein [Kitasatospora sp. NPDC057015]|uniref:hypothetical protein n=1 Tax=Kitasatospora sp. NPDC057015 TaxID=3346001 RepID=UPI003624AF9C